MDARSRDQMRNRRMKRNKDIPAGMKTDGVISIRGVSKTAEDPSAIDYDWERCPESCQRRSKAHGFNGPGNDGLYTVHRFRGHRHLEFWDKVNLCSPWAAIGASDFYPDKILDSS